MAPRKTTPVRAPVAEAPAVKARPQTAPGVGHNSGRRPLAVGRDGQPIYITGGYDPTDFYAVAKSVEPPGWVYEWKRTSVYNEEDKGYQSQLKLQGHWTPVQHETHPGVFGDHKSSGAIIHGGLVLMERPAEVHQHFQDLDKRRAADVIRTAKAQHALDNRAGPGIDTNSNRARNNSFVRTERVSVDDVPRASYNYDNTVD